MLYTIMIIFIYNNIELVSYVADSNEINMIPLINEICYKEKTYKIDMINFNLDKKAYEIYLKISSNNKSN